MNKKNKIIFLIVTLLGLLLFLIPVKNMHTYTLSKEDLSLSEDGRYYFSKPLQLRKDTYSLEIFYGSHQETRLDIYGTFDDCYIETLPAAPYGNVYTCNFALNKISHGAKLRFEIPADGILFLESVKLSGEKLLYTDHIYFALIWLVLCILLYVFLSKRLYSRITRQQWIAYGILAFFFIVISIPMLFTDLHGGFDLGGQTSRIEGLRDGISDGQLPVLLFPRAANEYGEFGLMYPYFFLIIPAFMRFAGISLLTVYKSICILMNLGVLCVSYFAFRTIKKDETACAISSVMIATSSIFVRTFTYSGSALGNGIAMVFVALAFVGLYHVLLGEVTNWWMLVIGISGILQSHLVTLFILISSFVLLFLFCYVYGVIQQRNQNGRHAVFSIFYQTNRFSYLVKSVIFTILLNIWWIAPFTYYYFTENLFLKAAVGELVLTSSFLQALKDSSFTLSLMMLCIGIASAFFIHKSSEKKPAVVFYYGCLMVIFLHLFACTDYFPWDIAILFPPLKVLATSIQFNSRFYNITVVLAAYLLCILLSNISRKRIHAACLVLISVFAVFANYGWLTNYYHEQVFATPIFADTKPFIIREYLPVGTYNENFADTGYQLSNEEIMIEDYVKNEDHVTFSYTAASDGYIDLPMFYYQNYQAKTPDGDMVTLSPGVVNRLRVTLPQTAEKVTVNVDFVVPSVWKLFLVLSLIGTVLFILQLKHQKN